MLFVFEFLKNSPKNFTRPLASDRRGGGEVLSKNLLQAMLQLLKALPYMHMNVFSDQGI